MILDIGPQTAAQLAEILKKAGTIVWNGPVGVFEFDQFANAPKWWRAPSRNRKAFRSPAAAIRWPLSPKYGIGEQVGYISTGGGAFLEFLEGKTLPAVAVLEARVS